MFKKFMNDESGATMIEYGLIGALVSVVAIGALILLGGGLEGVFTSTSTAMVDATS